MQEPCLDPYHITGRTSARQSLPVSPSRSPEAILWSYFARSRWLYAIDIEASSTGTRTDLLSPPPPDGLRRGAIPCRGDQFLDDLMPVWAGFSFAFSNSIRARCRSPFFEFPFDIDILALSLDLHFAGLLPVSS